MSTGSGSDKAKLLFDMYDVRGSGQLSKEEFSTMLRSLMELANTRYTSGILSIIHRLAGN